MKNGVDLNHITRDMDFGRGFYTTTDINQAQRWIKKKFKGNGGLIEFNIPKRELDSLSGKVFTSANSEWVDFVYKSRNGMRNNFDYISGPMVANPKATKSPGNKLIPVGQQTAFNTQVGIDLLNKYMKR